MEITYNTILIQKEDGKLYFKDGDIEELASLTEVCKHYRNMQYSLTISNGCLATHRADIIELALDQKTIDKHFFKVGFCEMPENCRRIK